jgi:hypothetical protein
MDLHPGERIVFEGHPSWRALLSFYVSAIAAAIVVAVVVALVASIVVGVLLGVVLIAAVVVVGLVRRMATVYLVTSQRLSIRRGVFSKRVQHDRLRHRGDRRQRVPVRRHRRAGRGRRGGRPRPAPGGRASRRAALHARPEHRLSRHPHG